jgi:hypothetical protein
MLIQISLMIKLVASQTSGNALVKLRSNYKNAALFRGSLIKSLFHPVRRLEGRLHYLDPL